jgi:hypothetical protein
MQLVRLIKMCLNERHSKVCIVKYVSDSFPIQNGKSDKETLYHHCSSTLLWIVSLEGPGKPGGIEIEGTN